MDTSDPVQRQLRKLREGAGLTLDRLQKSGAVMSALGTSDPQEAHQRLTGNLSGLADQERLDALRVDFALDLERLLQRRPTTREIRWLGDRRASYAELVGRDVKTLARWSDKTIEELRATLLTDFFDGDLIVMAGVERDRIAACTMFQLPLDSERAAIVSDTSTTFNNPTKAPSMPCLIYAFPRDWRPRSLTLGVAFRREPYPRRIWGITAPTFLDLAFAEERYDLTLDKDTATCKFVNPRRDRLYGIFWISTEVP